MKMITLKLTDVDVEIIKFVDHDAYSDFGTSEVRRVDNIVSEIDEIERIRREKPIAFARRNDGSYVVIKHKVEIPA
jgi:hypothetical protein